VREDEERLRDHQPEDVEVVALGLHVEGHPPPEEDGRGEHDGRGAEHDLEGPRENPHHQLRPDEEPARPEGEDEDVDGHAQPEGQPHPLGEGEVGPDPEELHEGEPGEEEEGDELHVAEEQDVVACAGPL